MPSPPSYSQTLRSCASLLRLSPGPGTFAPTPAQADRALDPWAHTRPHRFAPLTHGQSISPWPAAFPLQLRASQEFDPQKVTLVSQLTSLPEPGRDQVFTSLDCYEDKKRKVWKVRRMSAGLEQGGCHCGVFMVVIPRTSPKCGQTRFCRLLLVPLVSSGGLLKASLGGASFLDGGLWCRMHSGIRSSASMLWFFSDVGSFLKSTAVAQSLLVSNLPRRKRHKVANTSHKPLLGTFMMGVTIHWASHSR